MWDWVSKEEIETMKRLKAEGCKAGYIAFKTGRSVDTVGRYTGKKVKRYYTPEEIKKALIMKAEGKSDREIGEKLNRTRCSISQMFQNVRRGKYAGYSL